MNKTYEEVGRGRHDSLLVHKRRGRKLHCTSGPSEVKMFADGGTESQRWGVQSETWCRDGLEHRDDGPSYVSYNEEGSIYAQEWQLNGKNHREDGPAYFTCKVGAVFPGDTRSFEDLERAGVVNLSNWFRHGRWYY